MKKPSLKPVVLKVRKKAHIILHAKYFILLLTFILNKHQMFAQTKDGNTNVSNAVPLPPGPVSNAGELITALNYYATWGMHDCNDKEVITFTANAFIDLSTIQPENFPLIVPIGTVLQGDYSIYNCANGYSTGTTIYMPYLFQNGYSCAGTASTLGSAFIMEAASEINHIRLIGGRSGDVGVRYQGQANMCNGEQSATRFMADPPLEGIASGIIAVGNNIRITHCEIENFNLFGAEVRDMVTNGNPPPGNQPCYTSPDVAQFYFEDNYTHNCKVNGFGYGFWASGGGGQAKCIPLPGPVWHAYDDVYYCIAQGEDPRNDFYNYDAPVEQANVSRCCFLENNHDIDGTHKRVNMIVDFCSFSERNLFSVTRHTDPIHVCYPNHLVPNVAPCNNHDPTKWPQPCNEILTEIGGHQTSVRNCTFHKPVYNFEIPYPNINTCTNQYNSPGLNDPIVDIGGNYFNTLFNNSTGSQEQRIMISGTWHTQWNYAPNVPTTAYTNDDSFLTIGELALYPNYFNRFYQNLTPANTPYAEISSTVVGSGQKPNNQTKDILVGQSINFVSDLCRDGFGNQIWTGALYNNCVFMYRFHEMEEDETDEYRVTGVTTVNHIFNKAGIVNVTLMLIDEITGMMSNIATQQILVRDFDPYIPSTFNNEMTLRFSYKDSHLDEQLKHTGTCLGYDNVNNRNYNSGLLTRTNMEIYAMVDNVIVFTADIMGDEGWKKAVVDLKQFFTPPFYGEHTLEIGIRAVGPVDAGRVRGVKFYIDDISLDNWRGYNCIPNGDLETTKTTPSVNAPYPHDIDNWDLLQEYDFNTGLHGPQDVLHYDLGPYVSACTSPPAYALPAGCSQMTLGSNGGTLSTYDVRSGHWSYEGWVRPMNAMEHNCPTGASTHNTFDYYTGLTYNPGYYKAIRTTFHRNPTWADNGGALKFHLQPNPAPVWGNGTLVVIEQNERGRFVIEATDITGKKVLEAITYNTSYRLPNNLKPGVYYVMVTNGEKRSTQKLAITK
jgi:hypothetical protein